MPAAKHTPPLTSFQDSPAEGGLRPPSESGGWGGEDAGPAGAGRGLLTQPPQQHPHAGRPAAEATRGSRTGPSRFRGACVRPQGAPLPTAPLRLTCQTSVRAKCRGQEPRVQNDPKGGHSLHTLWNTKSATRSEMKGALCEASVSVLKKLHGVSPVVAVLLE